MPQGHPPVVENKLRDYTQSIFAAYNNSKLHGEILCYAFVTAFCPYAVRDCSRTALIECKDILTQRGVYLDPDRANPPTQSIIDIIYLTEHVVIAKERSYQTRPHGVTWANIAADGNNRSKDGAYQTSTSCTDRARADITCHGIRREKVMEDGNPAGYGPPPSDVITTKSSATRKTGYDPREMVAKETRGR